MSKDKPKYHLITFGCQSNKSDSERLASLLIDLGMEETAEESEADLIVMNSCSVRQSAEDRVFGKLEVFKKLRRKNPGLIIAVTGCLPGRDKNKEIQDKMPEADLYFPTKDMVQLPRWLSELRPDLFHTGDIVEDYLKIEPQHAPGSQAFVSIQNGCNKFCSYCVVPYARGLEQNRPLADIMQEVRKLANKGVIEITLVGQAVNAYQAPDADQFSSDNPYKDHFAAVLWEVNQVRGLKRLHWTAAHPLHMTDEVIDALTLPKQINYLHLPVQSGSTKILKQMNRKYTREEYLEIIRKIKKKRPGIALGTDIIVGFCGETDKDFEETLSLYKEVDFDISYNARYSPRSGTLSHKLFKDDVAWQDKKKRWVALQDLMSEIVLRKNQAYLDKTLEVLVDENGDDWCGGNSRELKRVRFVCDKNLTGQLVKVKIKKSLEWMLLGSLV